jgi:hypothetical protein
VRKLGRARDLALRLPSRSTCVIGLVDRRPLGTLTVPWQALAPGYPHPSPPLAASLVLTYARPELVRRRGLVFSWRRLATHNVDPLFLGYTIAYYVAYPQQRPAICTQAEYDQLHGARPGPTSSYRSS